VSSFPQDIIAGKLASLLVEHKIIVNCKVFETNGKKQAFVQLETEEEATEALVCKHAISLSYSLIRISFSQLLLMIPYSSFVQS
jgi:polypyrimidine tract-binding protein 2